MSIRWFKKPDTSTSSACMQPSTHKKQQQHTDKQMVSQYTSTQEQPSIPDLTTVFPYEVLVTIAIYAGNPNLAGVNRTLHGMCRDTHFRARWLIHMYGPTCAVAYAWNYGLMHVVCDGDVVGDGRLGVVSVGGGGRCGETRNGGNGFGGGNNNISNNNNVGGGDGNGFEHRHHTPSYDKHSCSIQIGHMEDSDIGVEKQRCRKAVATLFTRYRTPWRHHHTQKTTPTPARVGCACASNVVRAIRRDMTNVAAASTDSKPPCVGYPARTRSQVLWREIVRGFLGRAASTTRDIPFSGDGIIQVLGVTLTLNGVGMGSDATIPVLTRHESGMATTDAFVRGDTMVGVDDPIDTTISDTVNANRSKSSANTTVTPIRHNRNSSQQSFSLVHLHTDDKCNDESCTHTVSSRSQQRQHTVAICPLEHKQILLMACMIHHGADVRGIGSLALCMASMYGHLSLVALLMAFGADPEAAFSRRSLFHRHANGSSKVTNVNRGDALHRVKGMLMRSGPRWPFHAFRRKLIHKHVQATLFESELNQLTTNLSDTDDVGDTVNVSIDIDVNQPVTEAPDATAAALPTQNQENGNPLNLNEPNALFDFGMAQAFGDPEPGFDNAVLRSLFYQAVLRHHVPLTRLLLGLDTPASSSISVASRSRHATNATQLQQPPVTTTTPTADTNAVVSSTRVSDRTLTAALSCAFSENHLDMVDMLIKEAGAHTTVDIIQDIVARAGVWRLAFGIRTRFRFHLVLAIDGLSEQNFRLVAPHLFKTAAEIGCPEALDAVYVRAQSLNPSIDIDSIVNAWDGLPLYASVYSGNKEVTKYLLNLHNVNVNLFSSSQRLFCVCLIAVEMFAVVMFGVLIGVWVYWAIMTIVTNAEWGGMSVVGGNDGDTGGGDDATNSSAMMAVRAVVATHQRLTRSGDAYLGMTQWSEVYNGTLLFGQNGGGDTTNDSHNTPSGNGGTNNTISLVDQTVSFAQLTGLAFPSAFALAVMFHLVPMHRIIAALWAVGREQRRRAQLARQPPQTSETQSRQNVIVQLN